MDAGQGHCRAFRGGKTGAYGQPAKLRPGLGFQETLLAALPCLKRPQWQPSPTRNGNSSGFRKFRMQRSTLTGAMAECIYNVLVAPRQACTWCVL